MLAEKLSPAGTMVRQDANDLRNLLERQPSEYHEAEADHFCDSFKCFQNALIDAQYEYIEHLKLCEHWRDLYYYAKSAG